MWGVIPAWRPRQSVAINDAGVPRAAGLGSAVATFVPRAAAPTASPSLHSQLSA